MKHSLLRRLFACMFAAGLAATVSAQVSLSYLTGSGAGASVTGQSFTPGDAGTFPTSTAYLTQMQFQTGMDVGGSIYLDVYTGLSAGVFSGYVGSSTNSNVWVSGATQTWSFDNLALDKATVYFAVFSTDATDGNVVNRPTAYATGTYGGGVLIYNGAVSPGLDAGFSATFTTPAVPEPATYGAFAGLAALILTAIRRRWSYARA